ncbi:hypothetical protein Q5P01_021821 [Channa striata]|uniref:Uncharacterized protein n=1 Tax=Channa striata TaxID=64152 RepID=A0AA88RZH3_CHASR|nr:hypothetical protein Q5P01_021821 [Channa striata]
MNFAYTKRSRGPDDVGAALTLQQQRWRHRRLIAENLQTTTSGDPRLKRHPQKIKTTSNRHKEGCSWIQLA